MFLRDDIRILLYELIIFFNENTLLYDKNLKFSINDKRAYLLSKLFKQIIKHVVKLLYTHN